MGVLEQHLNGSLRTADALARQARSVAQHGVPTGILRVHNPESETNPSTGYEVDGLSEAERLAAIKAAWNRAQASRGVAVLNDSVEFQPLSWNPEETQLLQAREFSLKEIANIFGLPPYFLGIETSSRVYANVEQEGLNLVRYALGGHLARFEQALSVLLPRGTWVKANLDSLLRPDTKTRYEAHAIAIAAGFLTVDEVRDLEERPPLTGAQREQLKPAAVPARSDIEEVAA
jgi:HK97 family phage portal protein